MPAAFAELVFRDCDVALHCPATGRVVHARVEGFDPASEQSPHLRFVVDWIGDIWAVAPEHLPADQAAYQQRLVEVLASDEDEFADQNEMVAACVAVLPESAIVFEILNPPQGSYEGEIAYFGFDLAIVEDEAFPQSVMLVPIEEISEA
jgi:hypothetical protein